MTSLTRSWRKPSVIPGFGITLGLTLMWLSLIVLLPLGGLVLKTATLGFSGFFDTILTARVLAALKLSFGLSLIAAAINLVLGLLIAWVLVRYEFPLRRSLSAMVDIPFALPTAVAGIALTTLYAPNGAVGWLFGLIGVKISFTPLGILVALIFIGLPFVVRTVEPVLADIDQATEEAAACLGATRLATFRRIILPAILPALLTGFALAFARAVGEYGSVIFIAGNLPMVSEIAPLLIVIKLEEFEYEQATAIAVAMLVASLALLFLINGLQAWGRKRQGTG
ncbi:MAG: sulfate ABC transporter permease subunit CysT [Parvibaculaceae bacterium]